MRNKMVRKTSPGFSKPKTKIKAKSKQPLNYQTAGVDIEAGDRLVEWLQKPHKKTQIYSDRIVGGIGGFAALFRMDFPSIKKPLLVSSTDGVGTKVKLASDYGMLGGVGQDLVAMCVNDLVTTGAQPLFFLDYYATGNLQLKNAQAFLEGLKMACEKARIALIGGETAEMPGVYQGQDFDCAGFAVGIVDESQLLGTHRVREGDRVLGISSSGCHSNGYSLLRKVFEEDMDHWVEELMTPTHLYVDFTLSVASKVHALANVTGGGIENLPRVIPKEFSIALKPWKWPKIFSEVQKRTKMSKLEMIKTLNCGIGFAAFCSPENEQFVREEAAKEGFQVHALGEVVNKKKPGSDSVA